MLLYRVEGGYRAYHATVLSLLRQHPGSIATANTEYRQHLCLRLGVQAPGGAEQQATPNALPATAAEVVDTAALQTAAATESMATEPTMQAADAILAGGVQFKPQLNIFTQYIAGPVDAAVATAEQAAAAAAKAVAKSKADAAAAVVKAATEAAAAEAAAAEAAAAAAAAAEAKSGKGGKDNKVKPAAASKPKEASSAADKSGKAGKKGSAADKAAAEVAAAEPPQPEFKFEFGGIKVPQDRSGAALCLEDAMPEVALKQVLQTLQVQFLEDMVAFSEETDSSGHSWAGEEEAAATEQLEARLRSHRYIDSTSESYTF